MLVPVDRTSGTSKLLLGLLLNENTEGNLCLNHFLGDLSLFGGVDMARQRQGRIRKQTQITHTNNNIATTSLPRQQRQPQRRGG